MVLVIDMEKSDSSLVLHIILNKKPKFQLECRSKCERQKKSFQKKCKTVALLPWTRQTFL